MIKGVEQLRYFATGRKREGRLAGRNHMQYRKSARTTAADHRADRGDFGQLDDAQAIAWLRRLADEARDLADAIAAKAVDA